MNEDHENPTPTQAQFLTYAFDCTKVLSVCE